MLADDIPPASDADRREDDADGELEFAAPAVPASSLATPNLLAPAPAGGDDRLRTALRETLAELEAIRALIPG